MILNNDEYYTLFTDVTINKTHNELLQNIDYLKSTASKYEDRLEIPDNFINKIIKLLYQADLPKLICNPISNSESFELNMEKRGVLLITLMSRQLQREIFQYLFDTLASDNEFSIVVIEAIKLDIITVFQNIYIEINHKYNPEDLIIKIISYEGEKLYDVNYEDLMKFQTIFGIEEDTLDDLLDGKNVSLNGYTLIPTVE